MEPHLFFNFSYASMLCSWLKNMLDLNFIIKDWLNIWKFFYMAGADHGKIIPKVANIFILYLIWKVRNLVRHPDSFTSLSSSISFIMVVVSTAGNDITVGSHMSLHDVWILKQFKAPIQPSCASNIVEVIWQTPLRGEVKLNYDGASIFLFMFIGLWGSCQRL